MKNISRKYTLAMIVIIGAFPMRVFDLIDVTTFQTLLISTLALYFTGNVAQKFVAPTKNED